MKQYILLDRLKVQNANAISGFTWGFPSITHFLGFTHNLQRKLNDIDHFNDLSLLMMIHLVTIDGVLSHCIEI